MGLSIVSGFNLSTCFDKEKDFSVNTVSLEIPIEHIKQVVLDTNVLVSGLIALGYCA